MYGCILVNTVSHTSGIAPCLQSIDSAVMANLRLGTVKRSASLSITDFEDAANVPYSPTKSKGSFIRIGSRKKTLVGSLSAGVDYSTLHTKQPYMLAREPLDYTHCKSTCTTSQVDHWVGQCVVPLHLLGLG